MDHLNKYFPVILIVAFIFGLLMYLESMNNENNKLTKTIHKYELEKQECNLKLEYCNNKLNMCTLNKKVETTN